MSFFRKAARGGGGAGTRPGRTHKRVGLKRRKVEVIETADSKKKKRFEDVEVSSDEEDIEPTDDVGSGDENYENARERDFRQAKELLASLQKQRTEDGEELDGDAIAQRLREEADAKAGTLHRKIASQLVIDEEKEVRFRGTHRCPPTDVAIHNDTVVSVGKDSTIVKYSIRERKVVAVVRRTKKDKGNEACPAHKGDILAVAISPDGKYVCTAGQDTIVKVWDLDNLAHLKDLKHHRAAVTALCFRLKSLQLFSASKDRTIKVWDLEQMGYVDTLYGHTDGAQSLSSLNRERVISCGGQDRSLRLWKIPEESQLVFNGLASSISIDVVAMINEDHFVSGAEDGVWSVFKKKPVSTRQRAHAKVKTEGEAEQATPWVISVAAAPFTDLVASGSNTGEVRLWRISEDYRNITLVYIYDIPGYINALQFSLDASTLACAVGREHRLGRWAVDKASVNSVVVLALDYGDEKKTDAVVKNGEDESTDEEESEEDGSDEDEEEAGEEDEESGDKEEDEEEEEVEESD